MASQSALSFMRQQGFPSPPVTDADSCSVPPVLTVVAEVDTETASDVKSLHNPRAVKRKISNSLLCSRATCCKVPIRILRAHYKRSVNTLDARLARFSLLSVALATGMPSPG